jgi:hypothetical protein
MKAKGRKPRAPVSEQGRTSSVYSERSARAPIRRRHWAILWVAEALLLAVAMAATIIFLSVSGLGWQQLQSLSLLAYISYTGILFNIGAKRMPYPRTRLKGAAIVSGALFVAWFVLLYVLIANPSATHNAGFGWLILFGALGYIVTGVSTVLCFTTRAFNWKRPPTDREKQNN